ncbi:MAG TPA: hypothetical protein VMT10_09370 [Solirubrobacteraceae bacterium]|nr:hypothetical protein [Solirubrobacteraceae bacterium]
MSRRRLHLTPWKAIAVHLGMNAIAVAFTMLALPAGQFLASAGAAAPARADERRAALPAVTP